MFRRILLWFGGMLVFSFAAFLLTSLWLSPFTRRREDIMRLVVAYQFGEAVHAYETGGRPALEAVIARLDRDFPAKHHLLNSDGRDLATGKDLSGLAQQARAFMRFQMPPPKRLLIRRVAEGGKYTFLIESQVQADPWADLAVYGWIVLVIVLLCYALAWTLARPIRVLREAVARFGRGDLAARAHMRRHDELGDLARAFDRMADRIETLLTAERRLLQDVSHELRSPLTRLRFALELARTSPDPRAALDRVEKEVARLSMLVGELLQVTRAEGDPAARNTAAIDLRPFVEALAEDCRIESEARGCTIRVAGPEHLNWEGDRELLHRAVENVLRNAVRHAPADSNIEIDLADERDHVSVRIRDYGPGVPDADLTHIFRPFFRVEEDRSRNGAGGVGLGLAIAERAVRIHHGEIRAANMNPGLMIELRLPR
jgi:signal transduction histidine kinase